MNSRFVGCLNSLIACVFGCALFFSATAFAAIPDTYPDNTVPSTAVQPQGDSLRTPYQQQPLAPVQLSPIGNTGPVATGSTAVKNVFFGGATFTGTAAGNYFTHIATVGDPSATFVHFDKALFASSHTLAQPITSSYTFTASSPTTARVYFVDSNSSFIKPTGQQDTNIAALGVINTSLYGPTATPLSNLTGVNDTSLVFPYANNAINNLPGHGTGLGRYVNNPDPPFHPDNEHPLLLGDMTEFSIAAGQAIDFYLMNNVGPSQSPDNKAPIHATEGIWFTNPIHNVGDTLANNFQHFQFYNVPELGAGSLLVAVESQGVYNGSNKDFNDLFFVIQYEGGAATPEPSTYLLVGTLLGFALLLRQRKLQENALE